MAEKSDPTAAADLRAASVEYAKRLSAVANELRSLAPQVLELEARHLRAVREASDEFTDESWPEKEEAFFDESGFAVLSEALDELHTVVAQIEEMAPQERVVVELCTAEEVANLLGLRNRRGVHVYRRRYESFPQPFIEKGRRLLWKRRDVERWIAETGRARRGRTEEADPDEDEGTRTRSIG